MEEIEKNVNFAFEMVEGFKREHEEKIKKYMEELKERFLTNHPIYAQSKKKKLQDNNQDKENETSAEISTSNITKKSRREEQLALGPSDKENDSSIETSVTKSSRRAREEPNPEPEFLVPAPAPALRPVRTAKVNASKNLREPLLNNKMRQPGSSEMLLEVKEEPVEVPEIKRERRTKKKIKQEKASVVPPVEEAVQRKSKESEDGASKKDSSVELVASNEAEVVELSDGEADKMPPPAIPVPKTRRARTKKKASNVQAERPIRESRIKKEKLPVAETSSARSSRRASGESHYEDALTGEVEERPVVESLPKSPVPPVPMNATFEVAKENEKEAEPEAVPANSSLMTEDNSIEVPIVEPKKVPQKKKPHPHELFNPCVQSPMRTKVEAFERHAAASALPIAKGTPSHVSRAPRLAEKSASTSKLTQIVTGAKKKSRTLTQSATKTQTRSASAEDNKRGLNALQLLAEEKRKKREERHKQAQQAREMREREKEERHRRLMMEQQEREEKIRQERLKASKAKQLQEQEQKCRMEELQRSQQKIRLMKAKESSRWGFDMLHSDDSTDDEDKKSNKRPPPPTWSVNPSLREQMAAQELVDSRFMDKFFMAKPMSVNLKEIFPDIDPRNLHRNSSVVWKTPPRFSQTSDFMNI